MYNTTFPPLPSYTLTPQPPLIPGLPDVYLAVLSPIAGYWLASGFFWAIDELDLFPQYRLHTPEEILKRNRVGRWEVFREVIIQHILQSAFSLFLAYIEEEPMMGKDNYNIAVWGQRLRIAQQAVPFALSLVGINALSLSQKLAGGSPGLAGFLAGGNYSASQTMGPGSVAPGFTTTEWTLARGIYHVGIPAIQFIVAVCILDTWQYFWHRAMHLNKWLYTTFHSRHHRLYVPYAYGALYNHPAEGFLMDTLGAGLAYLLTGMSPRQSMWFFTGSEIKTVDDHCGYAFPWDPLQHLTGNNAAYHDIHHQSWGIKTNFSQPFFTFWDRFMDTKWKGDATLRYERDRQTMHRRAAIAQEKAQTEGIEGVKVKVENVTEDIRDMPAVTMEIPIPAVMPSRERDESATPSEGQRALRRSPRKRTPAAGGMSSQSSGIMGSMKELRSRVNDSLHGKSSAVLGVESAH